MVVVRARKKEQTAELTLNGSLLAGPDRYRQAPTSSTIQPTPYSSPDTFDTTDGLDLHPREATFCKMSELLWAERDDLKDGY